MTTRSTRPKKTEQNVIADAHHVAGAARRYLDMIEEVDARREKKLLTEERLALFESNIAAFAAASGGSVTGLALQAQATLSEAARRGVLYPVLRDVRADIKLSYKEDPAVGRAYGVGLQLSPLSTPSLLQVGRAVLSSWKDPKLRRAAEGAGIDEARMSVIAEHVEGLTTADTAQNAALTQGRGRTLTKAQLNRAVRSETAYVRQVAALVFRANPGGADGVREHPAASRRQAPTGHRWGGGRWRSGDAARGFAAGREGSDAGDAGPELRPAESAISGPQGRPGIPGRPSLLSSPHIPAEPNAPTLISHAILGAFRPSGQQRDEKLPDPIQPPSWTMRIQSKNANVRHSRLTRGAASACEPGSSKAECATR